MHSHASDKIIHIGFDDMVILIASQRAKAVCESHTITGEHKNNTLLAFSSANFAQSLFFIWYGFSESRFVKMIHDDMNIMTFVLHK